MYFSQFYEEFLIHFSAAQKSRIDANFVWKKQFGRTEGPLGPETGWKKLIFLDPETERHTTRGFTSVLVPNATTVHLPIVIIFFVCSKNIVFFLNLSSKIIKDHLHLLLLIHRSTVLLSSLDFFFSFFVYSVSKSVL